MANPTKVVFTLPTANTDGTVLHVTDVTGVRFDILDVASGVTHSTTVGTASLGLDADGNGSFPLPSLPSGQYSAVLYTEAVSQGVTVESVGSVVVPFVIVPVPSIPNPPVAVSVV